MNVNLRIGQIVIHGVTLTRREREQLAATVQQELIRQLSRGGRSAPGAQRGGGSALGLRIAGEVLAALPPGTIPGSAGLPAATQRPASKPAGPAAPGAGL
jgi:hypothetical protein